MKKSIAFILFAFSLIGCATSGKIIDTNYTDASYPFSISFPKYFELTPYSKDSKIRLLAQEKKIDHKRTRISLPLRPVYTITIRPNEMIFSDFIKKERENYYQIDFCFNLNITNEIDSKVGVNDAHLIYFTSVTSSDRLNNKGIIAFINYDQYYIKVEYISNISWYDENQFVDVIKNIVLSPNANAKQ